MDKKKYQSPTVIELGTVKELTQDTVTKCGSAADALTAATGQIGQDPFAGDVMCPMNGGGGVD